MNSGLYSVLYLTYFIILDSVLYFADIECGFSHGDRLPAHLVTMVTMGPVCLMKLTRKRKLVRTLGFFLDFLTQLITTGS